MVAHPARDAETLSVTEAAARGVPALVRAAESGRGVVVERRGQPVACVVSMARLRELDELEADLRDVALVLARMAGDDGRRTSLDDVIAGLGFDRAALDRELDDDMAAGRE